jgi:hypothetical protein
MKRIFTACLVATMFFAMSCGNDEQRTGNNSDSVLNSPPAGGADNTTMPGAGVDSLSGDSMRRDTTSTMPR